MVYPHRQSSQTCIKTDSVEHRLTYFAFPAFDAYVNSSHHCLHQTFRSCPIIMKPYFLFRKNKTSSIYTISMLVSHESQVCTPNTPIHNDDEEKNISLTIAHAHFPSFSFFSESGLEILTPSSTWSPVPVYPPGTEADSFPPILVNIGDLMQFWTEGLLKSTVHRVVFPQGDDSHDRYSIAYFCHPLDWVEIEAVPSDVVKKKERGGKDTGMMMTDGESGKASTSTSSNGKKKIITAEGYLKKRLAETYGWGKETSVASD